VTERSRQALRLIVGINRHSAPAGDLDRDGAGIVSEHASAERAVVGVEHKDFRLSGEAHQEFVAIAVDGEAQIVAGLVVARRDRAEMLLFDSFEDFRARLLRKHRGKRRAKKKCEPAFGHLMSFSRFAAAHPAHCPRASPWPQI
jgi:hypothetical protein